VFHVLGWYTLSIPNIEVSLTEEFKSSHDSAELQWIPLVYYFSLIPFVVLRVFEFIQPSPPLVAGAPMAIFKTIVDSFIVISQIIMTIQYNLFVNADTSDFYFTNLARIEFNNLNLNLDGFMIPKITDIECNFE